VKRLIVMRHAKSSWDTDAPTDHERPLNQRGRRDAPLVGAELARRGWVPDAVISSDSVRTRETWERIARALPAPGRVEFTPLLYGGGLGAIQEVLGPLGDAVITALLLGHNPGFEGAVGWLTGEPVALTTANAALLVHPSDHWATAALAQGEWAIEAIVRPKEL
jgi:phosphohistidine phosphatase